MLIDLLISFRAGLTEVQRLKLAGQPEEAYPVRPRWMSESMWRQCQLLEVTFDQFENLTESVLNCPPQWQAFFDAADPYTLTKSSFELTASDNTSDDVIIFCWEHLSNFQRLTLVRILKPHCLTSAARQFVEEQMGSRFVVFGGADLMEMYEKSDAKTPLIFLLSPGAHSKCSLPFTRFSNVCLSLQGRTRRRSCSVSRRSCVEAHCTWI